MTSYYSLTYLWFFLPAVMVLYQILPKQYRWAGLLGGSYIFYWCFSRGLLIYLLITTVTVYLAGLWMDAIQRQKKQALSAAEKAEKKAIRAKYQKKLRTVMLGGVLLNLSFLVILKYTRFFGENINSLLQLLGTTVQLPVPRFLLPLGISFYTMQAMSYLIDVYRGTVEADRSLSRVALFLSFFPQIMEGPICRYGETAHQLTAGEKITYHNMTFGMQRIIFGSFKKMIADHLDIIVKPIFMTPGEEGGLIAAAMVCYTIQLYMEFSGTMDVVIGSGEIFGVKLTENFQQPFLSRTISEFWTRWHITLGTWFRDYVFYPVSISKTLKKMCAGVREKLGPKAAAVVSGAVALFCVWILNGLWHGDGWQYLFFGMYHFTLILTGTLIKPTVLRLSEKYHINRESLPYRIMQIVRTVILVNIGELFFRADSLSKGLAMFRAMICFPGVGLNLNTLGNMTMDKRKMLMLFLALAMVAAVHLLREKGVDLREKVAQKNLFVRWIFYYGWIFFIILFGAYGANYEPLDPIYANF